MHSVCCQKNLLIQHEIRRNRSSSHSAAGSRFTNDPGQASSFIIEGFFLRQEKIWLRDEGQYRIAIVFRCPAFFCGKIVVVISPLLRHTLSPNQSAKGATSFVRKTLCRHCRLYSSLVAIYSKAEAFFHLIDTTHKKREKNSADLLGIKNGEFSGPGYSSSSLDDRAWVRSCMPRPAAWLLVTQEIEIHRQFWKTSLNLKFYLKQTSKTKSFLFLIYILVNGESFS